MTTTTIFQESTERLQYWERDWAPQPAMLILEGHVGSARRTWLKDCLEEMGRWGARTFLLSCDFDSGGPWAGVNQFFLGLLPEIQAKRPDLIERHSLELVYVLPELRRTLTVQNPNLTDLAQGAEKTRNYPADRVYRNAHGLIDLLDSWKSATCPDTAWVIGCESLDNAGAIGGFFFRELMRRREKQLNLRLLASVEYGNGAAMQTSFSRNIPAQVLTLDLVPDAPTMINPSDAAQEASDIERRVGEDPLETKILLCDLIRLWQAAGRSDKLFRYRFFALETYNTAGLYADALRYGDALLDLAAEHAPGDDYFRWSILLKLIMSHLGLEDAESAIRLAEEEGQKLADRHADLRADLYYLLAMFCSRFTKPRKLDDGEKYLELGLEALAEADMPDGQRYFKTVFNRNGLAMIRNFQQRHKEAIELCRAGIETLNAHLGAEEHRLHRSVLFYNMAQVYAVTGSHDEAIKYYSAAMEMDPNYSEYYNERGSVLLKLGRLDEARADYLTAIELSPPYFEVFANLGQCYRRMGAMELAIEAYSRALDLEPQQALALLGRAKAHEELGHRQAALDDYTAALRIDPGIWEALASRAVLHYEAGDLAASLADLDAAIQVKKDSADLYQNRATVLADLNFPTAAIADLQSALTVGVSDEDRIAIERRLQDLRRVADQRIFSR